MSSYVYICLLLFTSAPVWSQLVAVPYSVSGDATDGAQMQTPPPVSQTSYPTSVGSETRSNYLSIGANVNVAYDDNVLADGNESPIGDTIYSISPSISFDKSSPRQRLSLSYSPGYTFYQRISSLDSGNQTAAVNFLYRISEHTTLNMVDSFQRSSNLFDQLYPSSGGVVSGSTQTPPTQVTPPYGTYLSNTANFGFSHQISRDSMLGANGIATNRSYPNPGQATDFYNSSSWGGSGFYSRRLGGEQYLGVTYEYQRSLSNPTATLVGTTSLQTEVQTHSFLAFYTIYLNRAFSLSISGGPQYFDAEQYPSASASGWSPSVTGSFSWQKPHSNIAASFSKTITGSNGLAGASDSTRTNASWRWQYARTWTVGLAGIYSVDRNVTPLFPSSTAGGHTISGTASIQHTIGDHASLECGYARLHQSYSDIPIISEAPDSDRLYISFSYRWTRPIGR
jgi:hypothetical protein